MQDFTASAGPQGCPLDELIAFLTARLDEAERSERDLAKMFFVDITRVLRGFAADRALLGLLDRAIRYRDRVFARPEPRSVSDEMRAVTQMLALEQVLRLRAGIWSDHPDYQAGWAP